MSKRNKEHHNKHGFCNPPGSLSRDEPISEWLKFLWHRIMDKPPNIPEGFVVPEEIAKQAILDNNPSDILTWLGHASFLIRLGGKYILTDPYLTDYAAPVPGILFKRIVPPGISISSLPKIDVIVVSHNHYDHLDTRTLSQLPNKESIQIVVPLKLGKIFKKLGFKHICELDWHEAWSDEGLNITALPAIHFSQRKLFDRNESLWAGFEIKFENKNLFFSGDTAYSELFKEVGEEYGPFSHAMIGIGAYLPANLMRSVHVTPEEAVQIGQDIQAKRLVGMHWGTLQLTDEPIFEPAQRFVEAGSKMGYNDEDLWILNIGETRLLKE